LRCEALPAEQAQQCFAQICQQVEHLSLSARGRRGSPNQHPQQAPWELHCSECQLQAVVPLAAEVRQLCLQHEGAALALVQAALLLPGSRLQQLLVRAPLFATGRAARPSVVLFAAPTLLLPALQCGRMIAYP
jgi:hypothetical protein